MTQLESALNNKISPLVSLISKAEKIPAGLLRDRIASGKIVIPNNKKRRLEKPCGVGEGLRVKINANIGTSGDKANLREELKKLTAAQKYGSDTVMDLSTSKNISGIRKALIKKSGIPFGTVPVYEAAVEATEKKGSFLKMTAEGILSAIKNQAEDGVDFMTIHSGITKKTLDLASKSNRVMGVVSRGGAIIANWMARNNHENPFYEYFDQIVEIAYQYDITLSLGDGLRPGSILDATDRAQISELKLLGGLAKRARNKKVQVIIEGPGHVPLNQIKKNMELEKKFCQGAPFYVLGPLVTDIGASHDHISGAIGGALAAAYGADFLCVVTPAEHLAHPSLEDIKEGVIASRIAAHAADIVKGIPGALDLDKEMSIARQKRNWKKQISLSIDPKKASAYRTRALPRKEDVCTMCSEYCSIKLFDECKTFLRG